MSMLEERPKLFEVDHCPACQHHLTDTWDDDAQACSCGFRYMVPEWIANEPETLAGRIRRLLR